MTNPVQVEIWSDIVCPWCYIGKRRFETALASFAHKQDVQVIWRSFELDPDAPAQMPGTLNELLAQKYDVSLEEAEEMNARVTAVAREAGLDYRLANARPGNTLDAHRLQHYAAARQLGDKAGERLMQAYFSEELAVGDRAALVRLAPEFGVSANNAQALLQSNDYTDAVRADEARAARFGISSVPYFVFNEKTGVSGAQSVEVYAQALQQAWDGT